jgi:hypothetical protein
VDKKGLIGEHLGFEVSTSFFNAPEEKVDQAIRALDELSSTESMTFTTESSLPDFSFTTIVPTEPLPQFEIRSFTNENESETDKREIQVDFTTSDMVNKYIFKLINKTYFFLLF